jgi:glutamine synthetase
MGNQARLQAISQITNKGKELSLSPPAKLDNLWATDVFTLSKMQESLPKSVFQSLKKTIQTGDPLDASIADVVAATMKDWAVAKGALFYTHIFYPLTNATAEKHDSFVSVQSNGSVISEFSGKVLLRGEPDGSSFPSGGLRSTFEARGYTAWDVTSPAYVMETDNGLTLYIPTVFVSWTGEALDKKTPLLRSNTVMNKAAHRVLKILGHTDIAVVNSSCGPEQEYFLVDANFANSRPDLLLAGRTLFGKAPAKGQQFSDHYFGAIPERVQHFMQDVEEKMYRLGIPAKTRHNEVAPGQFELAPCFEAANVATDHQYLTLTILRNTAKKHGFKCLLHEKPFAGINGSGKHVNWSVGNATQGNLLDPGDDPDTNAQFLLFCGAVIRGVSKYGPLLRLTVASAGNDHRLGANEAPPAIMSVYLGSELEAVYEEIKKDSRNSLVEIINTAVADGQISQEEMSKIRAAIFSDEKVTAQEIALVEELINKKVKSGELILEEGVDSFLEKSTTKMMNIGVDTLPNIPTDTGDRNRTSPFAFTGNRFEFRAVGSSQSVAGPLVVLNTVLTDSLHWVADELEREMSAGKDLNTAIQVVVKKVMTDYGNVIFGGDGYSEEWHEMAVKERGLKNLPTTADAMPYLKDPKTIELFERTGVLSPVELESRYLTYAGQYIFSIEVEAKLVIDMAKTMIYPAVVRYLSELSSAMSNLKNIGIEIDTETAQKIADLSKLLMDAVSKLDSAIAKHDFGDPEDHMQYLAKTIRPMMDKVREYADALEAEVADDFWPLPTYQEMLFIR